MAKLQQVTTKEIPKRELRLVVADKKRIKVQARVTTKEIPKRELRPEFHERIRNVQIAMLQQKKSQKGN